jgi:AraC-like DNA-binding protein
MRVDALAQAASAARDASDELGRQVAHARGQGASWKDIARRVGLTRQSAFNRWRHLDTDEEKPMRKTWQCPECDTVATYRHNLKKHLTGTVPYGGHEFSDSDTERILDGREFGT